MSKESFVKDCPEFLYLAAPEPRKPRYVFKDRVATTLDKAYAYAVELHEAKLLANTTDYFNEEFGSDNVKEVRDISWVYGPEVPTRHYRVTTGPVEEVVDYHVSFDEDYLVTSAEEYNRVI